MSSDFQSYDIFCSRPHIEGLAQIPQIEAVSGFMLYPFDCASKCDLATQKLPASSLAWQPTFSGGCEAQQQIALDEMLKFDTLLIAAGFQKEELVQESYRYVRETPDYTTLVAVNDTLAFTYMMGTFVGNFHSVTSPLDEKVLQERFRSLRSLPCSRTSLPTG